VLVASFEVNKTDRLVLQEGLAKLDYGYARDLWERLQETRCWMCRGSGYAPYVGGDDDESPCINCKGSGFNG
jgi:hypothetical protein